MKGNNKRSMNVTAKVITKESGSYLLKKVTNQATTLAKGRNKLTTKWLRKFRIGLLLQVVRNQKQGEYSFLWEIENYKLSLAKRITNRALNIAFANIEKRGNYLDPKEMTNNLTT